VGDLERLAGLGEQPVELVRWPDEARLRTALARAAVPRLLLVAPDAPAPTDLALDEDWIRLPAEPADVSRRAEQLARATALLAAEPVFVDDERVLHRAGARVPLPATAAAILAVLLERRGTVVTVDELERLVWAGAAPSLDSVHTAVSRLRRRLAGVHLRVRSVRDVGFVLDPD
jgi:two-component system, OmpR family, response regulator